MRLSKDSSENLDSMFNNQGKVTLDTLKEIRKGMLRYGLKLAFIGKPDKEYYFLFISPPNDIETAVFELENVLDSIDELENDK